MYQRRPLCIKLIKEEGLGPVSDIAQRGSTQPAHAEEDDAVPSSDVASAANPQLGRGIEGHLRVRLRSGGFGLGLGVLQRRGLTRKEPCTAHPPASRAYKRVLDRVKEQKPQGSRAGSL